MLETVKYLIGSIGPSGYGSKSTAEQVTECCPDLSSVTAIITGKPADYYSTVHMHFFLGVPHAHLIGFDSKLMIS